VRLSKGRSLPSVAEMQAFADNFMRKQNSTPLPEFDGLSPEQMHRMLAFPFDSPGLVSLMSPWEQSLTGTYPTVQAAPSMTYGVSSAAGGHEAHSRGRLPPFGVLR
jgi:hypothetical protein